MRSWPHKSILLLLMLTTGNLACNANPHTYRGPAGDDENSTQSEGSNVLDCGPEGIFDCSGQCMLVTEYEEWLSDGYCDSAEHSLANLNCAEHNFDGGDCCTSSCVDAAFECGTNDFACIDPQACAQEEECGEEEEATPDDDANNGQDETQENSETTANEVTLSFGQHNPITNEVDILLTSNAALAHIAFELSQVSVANMTLGSSISDFLNFEGSNAQLSGTLSGNDALPAQSAELLLTVELIPEILEGTLDLCFINVEIEAAGVETSLDIQADECLSLELGCTMDTACNISATAQFNNGQCEFPVDGAGCMDCGVDGMFDCSGECILIGEYQEWLGDGYCDGAGTSFANLNCPEHNWDGGDCCETTCIEAAFECGSNDFLCVDPVACEAEGSCDTGTGIEDCMGEWGGSASVDECGTCGGSGPEENHDCDGHCIIESDCFGECGGAAVEDCAGECGGSALPDACGVCAGESTTADNCDTGTETTDCGADGIPDCAGNCLLISDYEDWLGDGYCDLAGTPFADFNCPEHEWDGGDCCETTCVTADFECGTNGFSCIDPVACAAEDNCGDDTEGADCGSNGMLDCSGNCLLISEYEEWLGDGYCDGAGTSFADLNCPEHEWDGGDCCESTCVPAYFECGSNNFLCVDPIACAAEGNCDAGTETDECIDEWGDTAIVDECGSCGGDGIADDTCDCDGNVLDECGSCGGDGITAGACNCAGAVDDACGVCGGPGAIYACGCQDLAEGACDCDGNMDCEDNELFYDDGTFEAEFNAGAQNFSAVRFQGSFAGEDLTLFQWYQHQSGGAFYIKVWEDACGVPGNEIYSSLQVSQNEEGWNAKDLSDEGISVAGTFWVGVKEFSSSQAFGLDTDSVSGNSYQNTGAGWEPVNGNLGVKITLDNPNSCDGVADVCGVCDGTATDITECGAPMLDECGVCGGDGIADGACDCEGNVLDCAGECGGSAIEDCTGECAGDAVADECGVCDGATCPDITDGCDLPSDNLYLNDGAVLYNSQHNIAGFQFDLIGATPTAAFGGDTAEAGLMTDTSGQRVLAFSPTGGFIPAGCGTLTMLTLSGTATELEAIVVSDPDGNEIVFEYYSNDENASCPEEEEMDCNGECGGGATEDNCGLCDDDPTNDCLDDCNGEYESSDINQDGATNVLDVVSLVTVILDNSSEGHCFGDLNADENINILDIVIMVNLILEGAEEGGED